LVQAARLIGSGERKAHKVKQRIEETIESAGEARIDYLSIVNRDTLEDVEELRGNILIALAVFVGEPRLIDNLELNLSGE